MRNILYNIKLSEKQELELNDHERAFVTLFNQFRWGFVPGRKEDHPINIFRNFKNPKNHDLIYEMQQIKKHLINLLEKKPGSVWRGLDWSVSFQNWLLRTDPRIDLETLKKPIYTKKVDDTDADKLDHRVKDRIHGYRQMDLELSTEQVIRFKKHYGALMDGFSRESIEIYGNWYYGHYHKEYYEELLRLRIQEIAKNEKDIDQFLGWCFTLEGPIAKSAFFLCYCFCEYLEGKTIKRNLTNKDIDRHLEDLHNDQITTKSKPIKDRYLNIKYDESKLYTLRDIRSLIK